MVTMVRDERTRLRLVVARIAIGVRELVREVTKVMVAVVTCLLRSANHSLTCTAVP